MCVFFGVFAFVCVCVFLCLRVGVSGYLRVRVCAGACVCLRVYLATRVSPCADLGRPGQASDIVSGPVGEGGAGAQGGGGV